MEKFMRWAKAAFVVSGCIFVLTATFCMIRVSLSIVSTGKGVGGILERTNDTLDIINRPCPGTVIGVPKPCGTLADVARTLNTVRGTFGQVEVAARHENNQLTVLDAQEKHLFSDINAVLNNVNRTTLVLNDSAQKITNATLPILSDTDSTVKALNGTIAAAKPVLNQSTILIGHADDLVADPNVKRILANSQYITAQGAIIVTDAKVEEQKYVYPKKQPWYKQLGQDVLVTGKIAYHFLF